MPRGAADTSPVKRRLAAFPATRYAGSKRKLLPFLAEALAELSFNTALDAFGGTGAVSFLFKALAKEVTFNDVLSANVENARAVLADPGSVPSADALRALVQDLPGAAPSAGFIERTFAGIFYPDHENRFLDQLRPRLRAVQDATARAALFHSLAQACLAKRPYNLFHRANLSMRTSEVARSFGNKVTWETPFPELMERARAELARAAFRGEAPVHLRQQDVLSLPADRFDLVYADPPYVGARGPGVDYLDHYHFLEGLLLEDAAWEAQLDRRYKHRPLAGRGDNPWSSADGNRECFQALFHHFRHATLVVSYRSDGRPDIPTLERDLRDSGRKRIRIVDAGRYQYVLSKRRKTREVVLIAQ